MIKKVDGQWWRYRIAGDTIPDVAQESLYFFDRDGDCCVRSWPIPEHEALTELYCQLHGIRIPDGWEVVGFGNRLESEDHGFLSRSGGYISDGDWAGTKRPIIRRREPEFAWVTPTDDDAKVRPEVELMVLGKLITRTLVYVNEGQTMFMMSDGSEWTGCRMKRYKQ